MRAERAADGATRVPGAFRVLRLRRIVPLIQAFSLANDITFDSCLDIGCGRGRYDRWFSAFRCAREPRRYVGLDTDEEIVRELQAAGVDVRDPSRDDVEDVRSDLTLCVEVVEHLRPEESAEFFAYVREHTQKMFALTTPDFEYWSGGNWRPQKGLRECRWIPDHAPLFDPDGGPHSHKQRMTPALLHAYLADALDPQEWSFEVFRAWPWLLGDETGGRPFQLAFKIFALAWRRSCASAAPGELDLGAISQPAGGSPVPLVLELELELARLGRRLAEDELALARAEEQRMAGELAALHTMRRRVTALEDEHDALQVLAVQRGCELHDARAQLAEAELELLRLRQHAAERELAIEDLREQLDSARADAERLEADRASHLEATIAARRDRDLALAGWGAAEQARARAKALLTPQSMQ